MSSGKPNFKDPPPSGTGLDWVSVFYALGNISSSVALVLVNKVVFARGFNFPMTVTCAHFSFTVVFYRIMRSLKVFERADIPSSEAIKIAAAGVGSIGFMNISLNLNSVGFYQITKLAIVPCTLIVQAVMLGLHVNRKIQISLLILIVGLAWATVTDVHLNAPGFFIGVLAVLTTTVFQIWQGSKQKEFGVSGIQLQAAVAMWQSLQSLAAAVALENLCVQIKPTDTCTTALTFALTSDDERATSTLLAVLGTCLIAVCVNACSFGLIGRTSPTTYQVVGHTKTCLVLAGGFMLWPHHDHAQMVRNIVGLSIAMAGCVLYGHLKLAESTDQLDVFDRGCPTCLHSNLLQPKRAEAAVEDSKEPMKSRAQQPIPIHTDASIAQRRVLAADAHPASYTEMSATHESAKRG